MPDAAAVAAAWDLLRAGVDPLGGATNGTGAADRDGGDDPGSDPHADAGVEPDVADLRTLLAPVALAGPDLVVAQLGQSLDGRIATRTGDAFPVTGPADRAHLHRLRALVDAVVVGVGTVAADDPLLTVRDVAGDDPVRVVLDPAARAPRHSRVLCDGGRTLWCVAPGTDVGDVGDPVEVVRLVPDSGGRLPPRDVLAALAARGLRRVLVEGGGRTVSSFAAAGALHRLHLTVAPVLLGHGGVAGLTLPGPDLARDAVRPPSRAVRLGADICFDLDLRRHPLVAPGQRHQPG